MNFHTRIIHQGKGKTIMVEDRARPDLTLDLPAKPQKLNLRAQRLKNMARETPLGRPSRKFVNYKPGLLHEIADDGCRYIAGMDHVCCGAKAGFDSPWCEAHRKIVFQKVGA